MLRFSPCLRISPTESYNNFVAMNIIRPDGRQAQAVQLVERVYNDLVAYKTAPKQVPREVILLPPNKNGVTPDFVIQIKNAQKLRAATGGDKFHPLSRVKGLYLHGGVGCGKTMLMDILFHEAPLEKKMRVHFHQFMLDVQRTMNDLKKNNRSKLAEIDPFDEVAQRMVTNAELLCFDEIVVSDVSAAMIMKRLFTSFYKIGICAVFTSNRKPHDLYKSGLNRESFMPFIRLLEQQCEVHDMMSGTDYRLSGTNAETYFFPFSPDVERKFKQLFLTVTKAMPPKSRSLRVFGRDVVVPRTVGGVCIFDFHELCTEALSAADYEVIGQSFHTIFIENVPQFPADDNDTKRRFIHLIDTLYQYRTKIVVYAEVAVAQLESSGHHAAIASNQSGNLIDSGEGSSNAPPPPPSDHLVQMEAEGNFQMQRCVSRMAEMSTREYLEKEHQGVEVTLETQMY